MHDAIAEAPTGTDMILRALARFPERRAFVWDGGSLTYFGALALIGGALAAMTQPLGAEPPAKRTIDTVIRADIAFLVIELVLIALLLLSLATSTLSHIEAARLLFSGSYGLVFWVGVVAIGILTPIVLQALELSHRIPHTVVPAVLVLAGGFALRWVLVNAGQASEIVSAAARL